MLYTTHGLPSVKPLSTSTQRPLPSNHCPVKLPYTRRLQVNTDLNQLSHVLAWFDEFNQFPIPHSTWLECQLALAEAFTNAVRHAHAEYDRDTPVDIAVTVRSDAIEIRIWDYGSGFDLHYKLEATPATIEYQAEHGRGLKILDTVADRLTYFRDGSRNCLLLVKYYRRHPSTSNSISISTE